VVVVAGDMVAWVGFHPPWGESERERVDEPEEDLLRCMANIVVAVVVVVFAKVVVLWRDWREAVEDVSWVTTSSGASRSWRMVAVSRCRFDKICSCDLEEGMVTYGCLCNASRGGMVEWKGRERDYVASSATDVSVECRLFVKPDSCGGMDGGRLIRDLEFLVGDALALATLLCKLSCRNNQDCSPLRSGIEWLQVSRPLDRFV
jgi:hypothetical protein